MNDLSHLVAGAEPTARAADGAGAQSGGESGVEHAWRWCEMMRRRLRGGRRIRLNCAGNGALEDKLRRGPALERRRGRCAVSGNSLRKPDDRRAAASGVGDARRADPLSHTGALVAVAAHASAAWRFCSAWSTVARPPTAATSQLAREPEVRAAGGRVNHVGLIRITFDCTERALGQPAGDGDHFQQRGQREHSRLHAGGYRHGGGRPGARSGSLSWAREWSCRRSRACATRCCKSRSIRRRSRTARSTLQLTQLQQIQTQFASSTSGIGADISNFFNSLQQLSPDPTNLTLRQSVLTAASTLATDFNTAAEQPADAAQQYRPERGRSR